MDELTITEEPPADDHDEIGHDLGKLEGAAEVHADRAEVAAEDAAEHAEEAATAPLDAAGHADRAESASAEAHAALASIHEALENQTTALQSLVEELRASKEPAPKASVPEKPVEQKRDRAPTAKKRFSDRYNG